MSELDRAIGLTEANIPPRSRPRFILSRPRAAAFIVFGYVAVVALFAALLAVLEQVQAYNDQRNIQVTLIFAVVMLVPFGLALASVYRRSKRPTWPS